MKDGVRYPAMLFLTGANDPGVDDMQSRKIVARLQAASASDEPIFLRASSNTGRAADTPRAMLDSSSSRKVCRPLLNHS